METKNGKNIKRGSICTKVIGKNTKIRKQQEDLQNINNPKP